MGVGPSHRERKISSILPHVDHAPFVVVRRAGLFAQVRPSTPFMGRTIVAEQVFVRCA